MRIHLASQTQLELPWLLRDASDLAAHVLRIGGDPRLAANITEQLRGHPYRLFSYYYVKRMEDPASIGLVWDSDSTIMDSGLYSFMFGSEQGKMPNTLEAYHEYTTGYLSDLDKWGYKGWLVESDAHKLLGMKDTNELRKLFTPYEDRTIYVWHEPEGLDGLEKLALRHDYIAIGIPEMRLMAKRIEGKNKVERMTNNLLERIHAVCKRKGKLPPKVHLLGCTVTKMVQTPLAWSCDSTSWLSGARFGMGFAWTPAKGLQHVGLKSELFKHYRESTEKKFPDAVEFAKLKGIDEYFFNVMTCAHAFGQYQQWLDTRYSPLPTRGM